MSILHKNINKFTEGLKEITAENVKKDFDDAKM